MTVLPKINYLFSFIPTQHSLNWFKSLDSIITRFYWKNKPPRIKCITLQKPKSLGGLEAPHLYPYSLANQLQYIYKWIHPTQSDIIWLDIEQSLCENLRISDISFLSPSIKHHPCFKALTIASALTAWWKYHQITNSNQAPSKLTPLWNNPDFTSNKKTLNFHKCSEKGIMHINHIFQSNNFVSFSYKEVWKFDSWKFWNWKCVGTLLIISLVHIYHRKSHEFWLQSSCFKSHFTWYVFQFYCQKISCLFYSFSQ